MAVLRSETISYSYMKRKVTTKLSSWLLAVLFFCVFTAFAEAAQQRPVVSKIVLKGSVNPASAQYFSRALETARNEGVHAVLVELDTPGGLVSSLRLMVQDVMASKTPVIVYVYPSGSQAASAGALLLLSAHVAAMSPGTEAGAAHPVGMGGGEKDDEAVDKKAVNDLAAYARSLAEARGRNAEWAEQTVRESRASSAHEAFAMGVIDFVAANPAVLLRKLDGRTVTVSGKEVRMKTAAARIQQIEPTFQEKALMGLAEPNLAYLLFLAGLVGLYFELANPGAIFPGVLGAVSLLLGLYATQMLPLNVTGLLLMVLAVLFIGLEFFVISGGVLAIAGLFALFAGSIMLFDTPDAMGIGLSWFVFLPVFCAFALVVGGILLMVFRSAARPPLGGAEGLVGEQATVVRDIFPDKPGKVFVHGELWDAVADTHVESGSPVTVREMRGFQLLVTKIT